MQKLKIACCLLDKERLSKYGNQQFLKNLGLRQGENLTFIEQALNGSDNLITNRGINDYKL